jgi:hypothetical protein
MIVDSMGTSEIIDNGAGTPSAYRGSSACAAKGESLSIMHPIMRA